MTMTPYRRKLLKEIREMIQKHEVDIRTYAPDYYFYVERVKSEMSKRHGSLPPIAVKPVYRSIKKLITIVATRKKVVSSPVFSEIKTRLTHLKKLSKYVPEFSDYVAKLEVAVNKPELLSGRTGKVVLSNLKKIESIAQKRKRYLKKPPVSPSLFKTPKRFGASLRKRVSIIKVTPRIKTEKGVLEGQSQFVIRKGKDIALESDLTKLKGFGIDVSGKRFGVRRWLRRW